MTLLPEQKIRALVYSALRNLAHILLSAGIGAREFAELAKGAYVDEATARIGENGLPAPMAAVARATGLSRPAVKRLRGKFERFADDSRVFTPSLESFILGRWATDPRFLDASGRQRPLSAEPGTDSVQEIIDLIEQPELADHARATDVSALLRKMTDNGYLSRLADDTYLPIKRHYSVRNSAAGIAVALDTSIVRVVKTVAHNLDAANGETWIQRMVTSDVGITGERLAMLRRSIRKKSASFVEEIDDLLATATAGDSSNSRSGQSKRKAGVGLFYFEDNYDETE